MLNHSLKPHYVCLSALSVLLLFMSPATAVELASEDELIAILTSPDAARKDKAITCKHLAVAGTAKAVPALASLLADPQITSWARTALEVIPGPEASEALRSALNEVEGRTLIGVINSVSFRRDRDATDALIQRLGDDDLGVVAAASVALGNLGTEAARAALLEQLEDESETIRTAAAEGLILAAEQLLSASDVDGAISIYDQVRHADVHPQRIREGIRGAIVARQTDGIPLLVEQLQSDETSLFGLGLQVSRELPGAEVTEALIKQLAQASPDRQAKLILALADRTDGDVLPAVLAVADEGDGEVRVVAIEVLGSIGDASCLPILLKAAIDNTPNVSEAAIDSLERLSDATIDQAVVQRLGSANGKTRHVLLRLVGMRRLEAIDELRKAIDDTDAQIRAAAITALGETVRPEHFSLLISRVASPQNQEDVDVALKALRAAAVRMPDRNECAKQLSAAMADADLSSKTAIVEILGNVGGEEALKSLASAAKAKNDELQDTASRVLGQWMTTDAAPVLLELVETAPSEKYRIRAHRGYIRIARQFSFPTEQRVDMCRKAMQAARRDAERKLVLGVLERYPSQGTLAIAVQAAETPALRGDATKAALVIAKKLDPRSGDVREMLGKVGIKPMKIEIVKAEYGADGVVRDVTETVQAGVDGLPLVTLPRRSFNSSFGGDPVPGKPKQLNVEYRIDGQNAEASFPENVTIILPMPE